MSTYRVASLQKTLEDTVPASEMELANRQMNELTSKYRDLLQRENALVAQSNAVANLEVNFTL